MAPATQTEPLFISVAEAVRLLGISRSHAYDQAHLGLETNGREGLPAIRLGRRVLIARAAIEGRPLLDVNVSPGDATYDSEGAAAVR